MPYNNKFSKLVSGNNAFPDAFKKLKYEQALFVFYWELVFQLIYFHRCGPKYTVIIHILLREKYWKLMIKGILFLVQFMNMGICKIFSIIKTDINGNSLWEKKIGNNIDEFFLLDIESCDDGGFIAIGGYFKIWSRYNTDAFIIKLNACAEIDWCRVLHSSSEYDGGKAIEVLEDGYIALTKYYGSSPVYKRIWLFRLDETGEILWKKVYAQTIPGYIMKKHMINTNFR